MLVLVVPVLVVMVVVLVLVLARIIAIPQESAPQAIAVGTIPKECSIQVIAGSCKLEVLGARAGAGDENWEVGARSSELRARV